MDREIQTVEELTMNARPAGLATHRRILEQILPARRFARIEVDGRVIACGLGVGVHTAYLQVMLNNDPALRLYAKLGFMEGYQYWYRVKS